MSKDFLEDGYELEDLYQIGAMGFVKAIKRFDTNFEVKLSTYAVPYILGEIKRYIRDDGMVKVSRSTKELGIKILEIQKEHMRKTGENISLKELEKALKISKEEIIVALEAKAPVESIYKEEGQNDDKGTKIIDKFPAVENEENNIINKLTISQLIEKLEPKERQIIILRFYKNRTQAQVGEALGISQVQVSRIEKNILNKMRMNLEVVWEK